jgi:hypothetical protein
MEMGMGNGNEEWKWGMEMVDKRKMNEFDFHDYVFPI